MPLSFVKPGRCKAVCNRCVGGIRLLWVGRLFSCALNCCPVLPLAPSPSAFLPCGRVWCSVLPTYEKEFLSSVALLLLVPFVGAGRTSGAPRGPGMPRVERFAALGPWGRCPSSRIRKVSIGCVAYPGPPQVRIETFIQRTKRNETNRMIAAPVVDLPAPLPN